MMPGEFDYHVGKRWLPMTKTRWTNRNDRRSLLLYLDPVDKRMKLRSIPDRVTPPLPRHLAGWAESARFNDSRVELFLSESRSPLFRWGL